MDRVIVSVGNGVIRKAVVDTRKDWIHDLVSRVEIDKTIEFLERHREEGDRYWTFARFLDEEVKKNYYR